MPAAKGKKLGQVLAVLAALVAGALPVGASIPRPGDQLFTPDPEALLAAALEPAPDPPQAEASVPGGRFELLAPAAVDRLLFTGRPARRHLFAELETRVRASDLLSLPQPLAIEELTLEIAPGDRETGLYYAKARYYDPELGIFLTQDPFEGQIQTPPSLHRYLYAYQNPTVYLDPTGRIAILKKLQETIQKAKEKLIDFADSLDDDPDDNVVERKLKEEVAKGVGVVAGLVDIADSGVGAVNFVVNSGLVDQKYKAGIEVGDLTRQAEEEILETVATTKQAVSVITENPIGVGTALLRSAKDTLLAAGRGDTRALAELSATATQVAVDVAVGSKGVGEAAGVSRRVGRVTTEVVEVGSELAAREAPEVAEAAGGLLLRRSRQAGKTGREIFEELPEAGRVGDDIGNALGGGAGAPRRTTGFVDDVEVTSFGKVVDRGTVDVRATVEGIESGTLKPRTIFENREGLLPKEAPGYYEEFVQPTPGVSGVGPQRIVRGQGGELYFTPDHYKTFIPLNP